MLFRHAHFLLFLGLCAACSGEDDRPAGHPDMGTEGDASARTDAPPPQTSHTEKTCENDRAWRSGRIGLTGSPRLTSALEPLFETVTLELRDRVERGCEWKLQVIGETASGAAWVPMHHGSTSFWSINAQKALVLRVLDREGHPLRLELSDLTISAKHDGDCDELAAVEVRGSLGEENDETRFSSLVGADTRLGDLIVAAVDRQITLSFPASPLEEK